jgi:hypothetical protein
MFNRGGAKNLLFRLNEEIDNRWHNVCFIKRSRKYFLISFPKIPVLFPPKAGIFLCPAFFADAAYWHNHKLRQIFFISSTKAVSLEAERPLSVR